MATNFGLSMGYNFSCMIASDTLFYSGVGLRDNLSNGDTAEIEGLSDVAMATNFGTDCSLNVFTLQHFPFIFTARRNACIASARCTSYNNSVCLSVSLSVCPSVCHTRYCVKTTKLSTVKFAVSDSKMCLVL